MAKILCAHFVERPAADVYKRVDRTDSVLCKSSPKRGDSFLFAVASLDRAVTADGDIIRVNWRETTSTCHHVPTAAAAAAYLHRQHRVSDRSCAQHPRLLLYCRPGHRYETSDVV